MKYIIDRYISPLLIIIITFIGVIQIFRINSILGTASATIYVYVLGKLMRGDM